ncbi:two-component system sensor histidine kinase CreC [Psychromonas aquimarina]|uniref:two-component system sensor histidine kinase CreC n=1 Tax=Psychromonas aquimarina TaxID=444919 RepID=UPI00048B4739|nr:two-component system sensor histidine kinase CreC [Psychromonas aquimarina]
MSRWPKIPLGFRLFLPYFVLVIITAYYVSSTLLQSIKPAVRQTTEETLIDTSKLLAVLVQQDLKAGTLNDSKIAQLLQHYGQQLSQGNYHQRIYVTDKNGIVLVDSSGQDVGEDYSQWNDVYLTLRGKYGARSTRQDENDPLSSVMYVAAPVYDGSEIIGSITVVKANRSFQPLIEAAKNKVLTLLLLVSVLALLIGAAITWRINKALHKLIVFAKKMGRGEKAEKPTFRIFYEYRQLSSALESMQQELDGKNYIEQYVQTLTHELKSPLAAVKGASEILQTPLSAEQQAKFSKNIELESQRMQDLIERLLNLAMIEQQQQLNESKEIDLSQLIHNVCVSAAPRVVKQQIKLIQPSEPLVIQGDPFLLQQAVYNLIENALDFTPKHGEIRFLITVREQQVQIDISNQGPFIPSYALSRVCERFYSLARPETGKKSTGLGLNFVEQVAKLHGGKLTISNTEQGVKVSLIIKNST